MPIESARSVRFTFILAYALRPLNPRGCQISAPEPRVTTAYTVFFGISETEQISDTELSLILNASSWVV